MRLNGKKTTSLATSGKKRNNFSNTKELSFIKAPNTKVDKEFKKLEKECSDISGIFAPRDEWHKTGSFDLS